MKDQNDKILLRLKLNWEWFKANNGELDKVTLRARNRYQQCYQKFKGHCPFCGHDYCEC